MQTVRYGARAVQVNREIEAKKADIWSQAVTAVYETDPEIVAAVLPPPLVPGPEPLVRITITRVEMPGLPVFGAGWIGVQARHEDRLGRVPDLHAHDDRAVAHRRPRDQRRAEEAGRGRRQPRRRRRVGPHRPHGLGRLRDRRPRHRATRQLRAGQDGLLVQALALAGGAGVLDQDPLLVYGEKTERTRVHEGIDGELILKEAPLDPVADLVVRRMVDINWTERASTQVGRIIGPVPRAGLEPYIHQRYDDLSVLGAKR